MDLGIYVTQLREDLASAAAAGDEQTRRTAALLGAAIEPAARLAVMNALSDLAAEVTAALGNRVVEVRLDGRDVRVAVDGGPPEAAADTAADTAQGAPTGSGGAADQGGQDRAGWRGTGFGAFTGFGADGGDMSRVTLRLVEQIKSQAERAAAEQGVSLNSWVAQAVQGALSGHGPGSHGGPGRRERRSERRVQGWVQG